MAFESAGRAKIRVIGKRIAGERLSGFLHLDDVKFSRQRLRKVAAQTLLTLAMVTGVTAVIYTVNEFIDLRHEIVFYFIPVLIAMLRWNIAQGFVAAVSGAIYANTFFYEPILHFYFSNPKRMVGLVFFLVALVIIGYLAANLRLARRSSVPIVPLRPEALVEVVAAATPVTKPETPNLPFVARAPTVPERVRDFLTGRTGDMYCDSCIQENLGLKWRQQVQLITATLGVTGEFKRDLAKCCGCEEDKQATQAVV